MGLVAVLPENETSGCVAWGWDQCSMVWGDIVLSPQFSPVTGQLPVEKSGEFSSHVFELAQCTAVISSAALWALAPHYICMHLTQVNVLMNHSILQWHIWWRALAWDWSHAVCTNASL